MEGKVPSNKEVREADGHLKERMTIDKIAEQYFTQRMKVKSIWIDRARTLYDAPHGDRTGRFVAPLRVPVSSYGSFLQLIAAERCISIYTYRKVASMTRIDEQRCFSCKHWGAVEDVPGVLVNALVATCVAALEKKKKKGDVDGYNFVLHGLSAISGFCFRDPNRRNFGFPVTNALKKCENWQPDV